MLLRIFTTPRCARLVLCALGLCLFFLIAARQGQAQTDSDSQPIGIKPPTIKPPTIVASTGIYYPEHMQTDYYYGYDYAVPKQTYYVPASYGENIANVNKEQYKEKLEYYKKQTIENPTDGIAFYNLGVVYTALEDYKNAIEAFKKAISVYPKWSEVYYNLGNAYAYIGSNKEAIQAYRQAVGIDSDHFRAHYNLGLMYLALKDRESAQEQYKALKAIEAKKIPEAGVLANQLGALIGVKTNK